VSRLRINSDYLVEYALLIVLVLIVLVCIGAVLGIVLTPKPAPAFSADVRSIVERCAEGSTSTYGNNINGTTFTSKSTDGDALLRCLYESNITINFHGDLVEMDIAE
jgi:hypothetical protein